MDSITKICRKCGIEKSLSNFPFQKNKCKQCYKEEHTQKNSKEYTCKNCGKVFVSDHESRDRIPKFCSRACAGYKKKQKPWNNGNRVQYETCKVCGKQKNGKREKDFELCRSCSDKRRAIKPVYQACPKCGKSKNGRGRSDRVLCNPCAARERWSKFIVSFGDGCTNKDYKGFTKKTKEFVRNRQGRLCGLCGAREKIRKLDVHHIDYNKKNSHPDNLIALCLTCHMRTNFNREYWKEKCLEAKMEKYNG